MFSPTTQAAGAASSFLMTSMIEAADKRRVEEDKKARKVSDREEMLNVHIQASASHGELNAKINAHFFGALKVDESPMAQLMSRFLGALGMQQGDDETAADFGTRVEDMLVFIKAIGLDEANLDPEKQEISLKRFSVSVEDLNAAIAGTDDAPSGNTAVLARFALRNGIEQEADETDRDFSDRFGKAVAAERKGKPASVAALEKMTGLRDLGITVEEMIKAIKNPHGEQALAIAEVLDDKAAADKTLDKDMRKVLQRLEDTADPKTLAELKLERTERKDPTRVEDDETHQEREEQIGKLEAGEKLEDVQDAQETIADVNDAVRDAGTTGTDGDPAQTSSAEAAASDLLQALAAGSETMQMEAEIEAAADSGNASVAGFTEATTETGETARTEEADIEEAQGVVLARAGEGDPGTVPSDGGGIGDILAVTVDENGIYDFLKRKNEEIA